MIETDNNIAIPGTKVILREFETIFLSLHYYLVPG
jgi:hypothetical protein